MLVRIQFAHKDCVFVVTKHFESPVLAVVQKMGIQLEVHERVPVVQYKELIQGCKFVLDTFPFGQCNVAIQAFTMGKVVLTLPSDRLYGRFVQGFYREMGIPEPVATSKEELYELFGRLYGDLEYRMQLEERILQRVGVLLEREDVGRDWNEMFDRLVLHEENSWVMV